MAPVPRRPATTKTKTRGETRRGEETEKSCFVYSEPYQNELAAFLTTKKKNKDENDVDATPPGGTNFELFSFVPNAGRGGSKTTTSKFSAGFALLKSREMSREKEMSHTRSGSFCEAGNGLVSIKQQREQREKEDKARARKEKEEMVMRAQQEQQHEQEEQRQQQQQQQNHAATNINSNPGNNTIIGFDDDDDEDDEMFQLVDIEALETRKRVVAPAQPQRPQHPQHIESSPVVPPRADNMKDAYCLPIALDGSGLEWVCEHGCALRECDKISLHFRALQPILSSIIQRLDDDEYMMKNIERKNLEKKRKEAETIQAFLNNGSIGSGVPNAAPSIAPMNNNNNIMDNNNNNNNSFQQNTSFDIHNNINNFQHNNIQSNNFNNDFQMNGNNNNFNNDEFYYQNNNNNNNGGDFQAEWDDDNGDDIVDMENLPKLGLGANGGHEVIPAVQCQMTEADGGKWNQKNFSWTKDCYYALRNNFGAQDYRGLQLQAINATMAGKDTLVLMPTGGGKSLCYQLPAIVRDGVTIVVCPLISLIQDQLSNLEQLDIKACLLGAYNAKNDAEVYNDLYGPEPKIKLLYVTPEKLSMSNKLINLMKSLHRKGRLQRFVIDEAHCISSWGHDFRKDYKELRVLKHQFPDIPVMALTATATVRVQDDIVRQLGLANCVRFFTTFNRTNITYEVIPKKKEKQNVEEILSLIHDRGFVDRRGRVECGIVYCFSKNDCEKMANALCLENNQDSRFRQGIKALPYHAGLDDKVRKAHQEAWTNDTCNIICATIAFGMGINKPDVRYVFHHSMPKSLEAYHQESGRAGRDGEKALCVLFYSWGDVTKARSMLIDSAEKDNAPHEVKMNKLESLVTMCTYCENTADCRRTQLLRHFNENFDRSRCKGMCDCCQLRKNYGWNCFIKRDMSKYALSLISICKDTSEQGIPMGLLIDVFRGSRAKTVTQRYYDRLPGFNTGNQLTKSESDRLARYLVNQGYLCEETTRLPPDEKRQYAMVSTCIRPGEPGKIQALKQKQHKVELEFENLPKDTSKGKKKTAPTTAPKTRAPPKKKTTAAKASGTAAATTARKKKTSTKTRTPKATQQQQQQQHDNVDLTLPSQQPNGTQEIDGQLDNAFAILMRKQKEEREGIVVEDDEEEIVNNDDNVQYEIDESIEDDDEEDEEERLYECVFQALTVWRDIQATDIANRQGTRKNPQGIIKNALLRKLAGSRPTTIDEMNEFREAEVADLANRSMLNKFAYDLVSKIEQAVFHFHNNEENPYTQTQRQQETQGNNLNSGDPYEFKATPASNTNNGPRPASQMMTMMQQQPNNLQYSGGDPKRQRLMLDNNTEPQWLEPNRGKGGGVNE